MFFGYILEIQNVIVLFINSSILGVMIEIIKDLKEAIVFLLNDDFIELTILLNDRWKNERHIWKSNDNFESERMMNERCVNSSTC